MVRVPACCCRLILRLFAVSSGMNGANHLGEFDTQPLHFCPVCTRKLQQVVGCDIVKRCAVCCCFLFAYESLRCSEQALEAFYSKRGQAFAIELEWTRKRLKELKAAPLANSSATAADKEDAKSSAASLSSASSSASASGKTEKTKSKSADGKPAAKKKKKKAKKAGAGDSASESDATQSDANAATKLKRPRDEDAAAYSLSTQPASKRPRRKKSAA